MMRLPFLVVAALVVGGSGGVDARAEAPLLAAGALVQDGSSDLTAEGGYAAPEVADWNKDGRKDLLVGQFYEGKVRLYLNQGTTNVPLFSGSTFAKSGGADITTEYG